MMALVCGEGVGTCSFDKFLHIIWNFDAINEGPPPTLPDGVGAGLGMGARGRGKPRGRGRPRDGARDRGKPRGRGRPRDGPVPTPIPVLPPEAIRAVEAAAPFRGHPGNTPEHPGDLP